MKIVLSFLHLYTRFGALAQLFSWDKFQRGKLPSQGNMCFRLGGIDHTMSWKGFITSSCFHQGCLLQTPSHPPTLSLLGTLLKVNLTLTQDWVSIPFTHVYHQLVGLFLGSIFSLAVFFRLIRKIGEGIGTPLQYSFPWNPMDRGAWHGLFWFSMFLFMESQSQIQLSN